MTITDTRDNVNQSRIPAADLLAKAARLFSKSGICALPAKRQKKQPAVDWKQYQQRLPTKNELSVWFDNGSPDAICILCGTISGNLEVLDFDAKAIAYEPWAALVGDDLLSRLVVQRTQNGGKHVLYRCESSIDGNKKLAEDKQDGKSRTLIETRGEGGLVLCAPSTGYEVEQGSLVDLPVLTADERNRLIQYACSLGVRSADVVDLGTLRSYSSDMRPGDDFNARGDIRPVLDKHGWRCVRKGDNEHWTRPGKQEGTSATFNGKYFYVFSTSTNFEAGKSYSKFAVFAILEYCGDYTAATIALRDQGYGESRDIPTTDENQYKPAPVDSGMSLTRKPTASSNVMTFPAELLEVPGFVGEFIQYCRETCFMDQPALFLAAGLSLQGVLAGRKIKDPWTNRPNIYTLGIAPTGTGKEWPRVIVTRILREIEADILGGIESPKSGSSLMAELALHPARIAMIDEFGKFMHFNKAAGMHWIKEILDYLLKLFSTGDGKFYGAQYAESKRRIEIDRPSLSLFGTAVGRGLWNNLTAENVTDGLLSRMLVFYGDEFPTKGGRHSEKPVPDSMRNHAQDWFDGAFVYSNGGNLRGRDVLNCQERVTGITDEARARINEILDLPFTHRQPTVEGRALASRTAQLTCKLALIYACSESATEPTVTIQVVEWAYRLAEHSRKILLHIATHEIHADTCEERSEQVLTWLRQAGGVMALADIGQKSKRWTPKERDEALQNLQDSGRVAVYQEQTAGRSRRSYRLINEADGGGESV